MGFFSRGGGNELSDALILRALSTVQEPELGGDLVSRRMIKNIKIDGRRVSFMVELTTPACPLKDQIQRECEAAIERIAGSMLDEVVISNTIPLSDAAKACGKIRQLSVAFLFAETIRRISDGESVTSLFSEQNNNF